MDTPLSGAPRIGIVVLAAGGSTRLRAPKQSLTYEGRSLLRRAAETAIRSACRPVIVVLGARAHLFRRDLAGLPVRTVVNHDWAAGIGSSIRAGITALEAGGKPVDGAVVMLCDQPLVGPADIDALVAAFRQGKGSPVASHYAGTVGVPALFERAQFPELAALGNGEGAKRVIERHRGQAYLIPLAAAALDIDTPSDLARLRALGRLARPRAAAEEDAVLEREAP
jgi:molybdenum cofactor cytidylyltransferase